MESLLILLIVVAVLVVVALALVNAIPGEYATAKPPLKLVIIAAALLFLIIRLVPLLR